MPQNKTPLSRTPFKTTRQIGIGGLVLKGDPQDIKDIESPDLRNITFDDGIIGPRNGTTLYVAAPVGETGTPTQLLKVKDSNGTTYLIGVYGTNFYLLDTKNKAWIKINGTYSPATSGLFYGSASWNLGTGSDSFYFGNGVDFVMKWIPMLTYLASAAASSDTQLTVVDSTLLPSSGIISVGGNAVSIAYNQTKAQIIFTGNPTSGQTIILTINGTGVSFQAVSSPSSPGDFQLGSSLAATIVNWLAFLASPTVTNSNQIALSGPNAALVSNFTSTSPDNTTTVVVAPNTSVQSIVVTGTTSPTVLYANPTNIVAVTGTVGANIANGTAVSNLIVSVPSIPKGNIFARTMASGKLYRLFVGGVSKNENILYYSQAYDPTSPSLQQETFSGGSGQKVSGYMPIIDGEGGIIDIVDFGAYLAVLKNNSLVNAAFILDDINDAIGLDVSPLIFGESVFPVGQNVNIVIENALYITTVSQGIYQLVPASTGNTLTTTFQPFSDNILSLFKSGSISFFQGRSTFFNRAWYIPCSTISNVNNITLVYDFVWNAWSIWDNLNSADMQESQGVLYSLCSDDGGLYYLDPTSNQDFRGGVPVGYNTYLFTKRFDWEEPANPKQQSLAMIQGYISQTTKLYVDVLFNENGSLAGATYEIDGNNTVYVQQIPIYTPGRISLGQNPIGGAQAGTIGVFRVYLDLQFGAGAHVVQFKVYTGNIGDNWGLTGVSVDPVVNEMVPAELKIGVI